MEIKDFIEDLGISVDGNDFEVSDNSYKLELNDSDDFSQLFAIVSNSNSIFVRSDSSVMTEEGGSVEYENKEFEVLLNADYENDVYTFTVNKK